mgnify:CR=1 FL=1
MVKNEEIQVPIEEVNCENVKVVEEPKEAKLESNNLE